MKKYVMLIAFTASVIVWVLVTPMVSTVAAVKVTGIKVKFSSIQSTADCSGVVFATKQQIVNYGYSVKPENVYVKIGDSIASGQKLMDISKKETAEAINATLVSSSKTNVDDSNSTDNNTDSSVSEAYMSGDYSSLISQYYANKSNSAADSSMNASSSTSTSSSSSSESNASDEITNDIPDNVYSNISGIVTQVNVTSGNFTQAQSPLIVVTDINSLQIKAEVDESDISEVQIGQQVSINGLALSKQYSGKVIQIYPTAHSVISDSGKKNVVSVIISIDHADGAIKPGYSTDIVIHTAENNKAVILPYTAVDEDNANQKYIYICNNGKAVRKNITTGKEYANDVEVVNGVTMGDVVISNPTSIKNNGAKISIRSIQK